MRPRLIPPTDRTGLERLVDFDTSLPDVFLMEQPR
jgi:hypothetical protein